MNSKQTLAIVGIGCRFADGCTRPDILWNYLLSNQNASKEIPPDRWNWRKFYGEKGQGSGKMHAKSAAFLNEDPWLFDPLFFGMNPREAEPLDPQQRWLLKAGYDALLDAGMPANRLKRSRTGVYVGAWTLESMVQNLGTANSPHIDNNTATSCTSTIVSARLSYFFDLTGPCVSIDTACSSSLCAFHLACQGIWNGDCEVALAGGVNAIIDPSTHLMMSQGGYLSADGRCKTFSEDADGYGRGEGCGVVVIKPLAQALADGDQIYCAIEATGVNQDGHTRSLPVPNADSQKALLKQVMQEAGATPDELAYVEVHGTGTAVGDSTEMASVAEVLGGEARKHRKLWVSSIKSQFGHMEAAAGIAGIIKAALVLKHEVIPPHHLVGNVHPDLPFDGENFAIPFEAVPLEPLENKRTLVGINSFGYGGTNAFALLSHVDQISSEPVVAPKGELPVVLTAYDEALLPAVARRLMTYLDEHREVTLEQLSYLSLFRCHRADYNLSLLVSTLDELHEKLELIARDELEEAEQVFGRSTLLPKEDDAVFVYTGMGAQWPQMGYQLYQRYATFRRVMDECAVIIEEQAGWSLMEEIAKPAEDSRISEATYAQPAVLAIQMALTELWKEHGCRPTRYVGHSIGEISAACASGALSLHDALCISIRRCKVLTMKEGAGTMLAVSVSEDDARALIEEFGNRVSLAAINSGKGCTLAGQRLDLASIAAHLGERGIFNRFLDVDIPYHSKDLNELADVFTEAVQNVVYTPGSSDSFYSCVTGGPYTKPIEMQYWWDNVQDPVRFHQAIVHLLGQGHRRFVEVGPHPVLSYYLRECSEESDAGAVNVHSLYRDRNGVNVFRQNVCALIASGYAVQPDAYWSVAPPMCYLPLFAWREESHRALSSTLEQYLYGQAEHPILVRHMPMLSGDAWQSTLNLTLFPELTDHRVQRHVVVPGAFHIAAALAASKALQDRSVITLAHLKFSKALLLSEPTDVEYRIEVDERGEQFRIASQKANSEPSWLLHAEGRISTRPYTVHTEGQPLEMLRARCPAEVDLNMFYESLRAAGLDYGPQFRQLASLTRGEGEVFAHVKSGQPILNQDSYALPPPLLDACFQALFALDMNSYEVKLRVPVFCKYLQLIASPGDEFQVHARLLEQPGERLRADLTIYDSEGNLCAILHDFQMQSIATQETGQLAIEDYSFGYSFIADEAWQEADTRELDEVLIMDAASHWGAMGTGSPFGGALQRRFEGKATHCHRVALSGDQLPKVSGDAVDVLIIEPKVEDDPTGQCEALKNLLKLIPKLVDLVDNGKEMRLRLLTHSANPTEDEPLSCMVGFFRTLTLELPQLKPQTIVLSEDDDQAVEQVMQECSHLLEGKEIAWSNGMRYIHSFQSTPETLKIHYSEEELSTAKHTLRVAFDQIGDLSSVHLSREEDIEPGPNEVACRIHYAGMNFKDILKAMGQLDKVVYEGTISGAHIGMEAIGVVEAVGSDVSELKAGDHCALFAPKCWSTRVCADRRSIVKIPEGVDPQKVNVLVYATVIAALRDKAQLKPEDTLLIHAASGGIGIAAIEYAQKVGARIIATAGSEEKRAFVRRMGVEHVVSSRGLEFADAVRELTDGRGVDVALSALEGDTLLETWELLARHGRYVDLGKADMASNRGLPMAPFNESRSYLALDLDRQTKEHIQELLKSVVQGFADGTFTAMPVTAFKLDEIEEAFRLMSRFGHIGKIQLDMRKQSVTARVPVHPPFDPRDEEACLIVGGFSGFGSAIAKRLVERGVKHIVLMGRSGAATSDAKATVAELENMGAKVISLRADVTDRGAVFAELDAIQEKLPIAHIVHAATTYDDSTITAMTEDQLTRVLATKVKGAWNLHTWSLDKPVRTFIMFSSITSPLGTPGQANYVAANAFLDGLAHHRRAAGLAATAINWGAIGQIGVLTRSSTASTQLGKLGLDPFSLHESLQAFDHVLDAKPSLIAVSKIDPQRLRESFFGTHCDPLKFERLLGLEDGKPAQLEEETEVTERSRDDVVDELIGHLSDVTSVPKDHISTDKSLGALSFDSLMAIELETKIRNAFGVEVSSLELLQLPKVTEVVRKIMERMP